MRAAMIGFVMLAASAAAAAPGKTLLSPIDAERIARAAEHVAAAPQGQWAFAVIEESATKHFVQFAPAKQGLMFDFPVIVALRPHRPSPVQDRNCSRTRPPAAEGEVEQRQLAPDAEARLVSLLDERKLLWARRYCLSMNTDNERVGYTLTIVGGLADVAAAPLFVDAVFREVYRIDRVERIDIKTDQ